MSLAAGSWSPHHSLPPALGGLGMLLLQGVLLRRETLAGRRRAEPVVPGDLVRPLAPEEWAFAASPTVVAWSVLTPARLAGIDRELLRVLGEFPEVIERLVDRLSRRMVRTAQREVIGSEPGLSAKVHAELSFFADVCGRVTPDGVLVRVPLSQGDLAEIVGARRQSLNKAVRELRESGVARQLPDGTWWLARPGLGLTPERSAEPVTSLTRPLSAS